MEGKQSRRNLLMCVLVAAMVVTPVMCRKVLDVSGEKDHINTHMPALASGAKQDGSSLCRSSCSTPSTPSHGSDGGYHTPTPSHGGGSCGTPTTPSHGGGGYYSPPGDGSYTPSPVVDPGTPTPTVPLVPPTPDTPIISTPPSAPLPGSSLPPFFIGTCDFWGKHAKVVWGIIGYWGTLGSLLGTAGTPVSSLGILDALTNTRTDGVSSLCREGTAAFLNSMVNHRFPFTTPQVRDAFATALVSQQAAANQAQVFRRANEAAPLRH